MFQVKSEPTDSQMNEKFKDVQFPAEIKSSKKIIKKIEESESSSSISSQEFHKDKLIIQKKRILKKEQDDEEPPLKIKKTENPLKLNIRNVFY